MNKVVSTTLALALLPLVLVPGCIPLPGCGGFTGNGDTVLLRANGDVLIECTNGGFVAKMSSTTVEGFYNADTGVDPASLGVLFTQTTNADGSVSTPALGDGTPWTVITPDQVTLDHANAWCEALTARTWWNESTTTVSAITEYIDPTSAPNADTHRLVLCPSGWSYISGWAGAYSAGYVIDSGAVHEEFGGDNEAAVGVIGVNGQFDSQLAAQPGLAQFWEATNEESTAAANFCATGVFTAPAAE